jgi:adenylate cyclase class IV
MKDVSILKEEIEKYNYHDLSVRTDGSIRFSMLIHNAQCLVTKKVLLIGNAELTNEEIEICVDDIDNINIDTEIILEMNGNYTIYINV